MIVIGLIIAVIAITMNVLVLALCRVAGDADRRLGQ